MPLKVKAKEQYQNVGKYADTYRYVMMPELYTALSQDKVIKEAALRSGVSRGVMQACWDAAGEVIKAWATEGHSVALPGLGTMRFGLRAKSVDDVNKVKTGLITSRRIIFTPDVDLKEELAKTAVQITCYDRDGKEVKRVTSIDEGNVEDPENEGGNTQNGENSGSQNQGGNQNGGSQNSGNTNQGGNSGSGSESLTSPTISGDTSFATSTQVSISGPEGAEIHYTTDGSNPTAESPVYSEAFTLSETTTVKAIAIKDGVSSQVVIKYFTKNGGGNMD
jgi:predicted histone-like DNA-binding protein